MAIDRSEFIKKIDVGLKVNKEFTRFYLRFKTDNGKQNHKIFDYSDKTWDKRTRTTKAKSDALIYKADMIEKMSMAYFGFDDNSTLDTVANEYFSKDCDPNAKWTQEKKDSYRLYIKDSLGSLKIKDIRVNHINTVRSSMEKKGRSKQTKNGCSPRTIKKALMQVLKPIMMYAYDNQILDRVPKIELSKSHQKQNRSSKKTVENAKEKLIILYKTIMQLYQEDPFYRALFLFALHGRRWGEIKTLEWKDINFYNKVYTVRAENNKINKNQTYVLTNELLDAITLIPSNKIRLVFESPITGKTLYSPKKQLIKIINHSKIDKLTMHYFRHILVSAMGEAGVATTILSASLGHTNLDTVNTFYLSANHTNSSKITNEVINNILQDK